MCGIAGVFHSRLDRDRLPGTIERMLARISHRGPDETGYFLDVRLAMGVARLSIIDLETGSQPLSDASGRWWICYNGELYNYPELSAELVEKGHAFRTRSDTEVVLRSWMEWGEQALERFNGAFAFAIYDAAAARLVLARDRFGKRPLFCAHLNGEFLFASEMKAFLEYPGFEFRPDPDQLASILAQWTPLPGQSGFVGIEQIEMGEYLVVSAGGVERRRYAGLILDVAPFQGARGDALERLRGELKESVRLRLRSDVDVGVYLSGGIDSSILASVAGELSNRPLSTFSIAFEDSRFDESREQDEVARHLGTRHHSERIAHRDIVEHFAAAVFHAEVPAFRTAFVPMYLLARRTRAAGIKVVLSGEGADEAFLGYDIFRETMLRDVWNSLDLQRRKERIERMYPWLAHYREDSSRLIGLFQQFTEENLPGLFSHEMRFQNGRFAARLVRSGAEPFRPLLDLVAREPGYASLSAVRKAQWLEFRTLLAGYLLSTQGERMSLAHGVENRCPFLDPNLVRFAFSVNLGFDDGLQEKHLLRAAFQDRLPERIVARCKYPYRAPDSVAFVNHRSDYLETLLSDSELARLDFVDARFAKSLTKKIFSVSEDRISTRENQAFIFLLSMALVHRFFVLRQDIPALPAPVARARIIDRREVAA